MVMGLPSPIGRRRFQDWSCPLAEECRGYVWVATGAKRAGEKKELRVCNSVASLAIVPFHMAYVPRASFLVVGLRSAMLWRQNAATRSTPSFPRAQTVCPIPQSTSVLLLR